MPTTRVELGAAATSNRIAHHRAVVEAILDEGRSVSINWRDAVTMRSNMTYEALEDVLGMLDFDKSRYVTRLTLRRGRPARGGAARERREGSRGETMGRRRC